MNSTPPIRHHTIPCSYLWNFSSNPQWRNSILWVYDRHTKKMREDKVDNFWWSRNFYTIKDKDWNDSYYIEEFLWDNVDNDISQIITKIDDMVALTEDEINKLALFIAFQELRTPSRFDWNNQWELDVIKMSLGQIFYHCPTKNERIQSLKNTLERYFPTSNMVGKEEEIVEKYEKWDDISFDDTISNIRQMLELSNDISNRILTRSWVILHNDNNNFIISDYPIFLSWDHNSPYWVWYRTAEEIYFPLSKKSYLIMTYDPTIDITQQYKIKNIYQNVNALKEWVDKTIDMLNSMTCRWTNRNVAGNDKDYLLKIVSDVENGDKEYLEKHKKA